MLRILLCLLLLNSCSFLRLKGNNPSEKKMNYTIKELKYSMSVNGRVLTSNKKRFEKKKKDYQEFLTKEIVTNSGEEIEIDLNMDSKVSHRQRLVFYKTDGKRRDVSIPSTSNYPRKEADRGKRIETDTTTLWIKASFFTLTIIPYFETENYLANIKVSSKGKLLCQKSCGGKYFYMMFLPLIVLTPLNYFNNDKIFRRELAGSCLQQCLAEN